MSFYQKLFFLLILFFSSCSSYRVLNRDNPLRYYGIKTVSVPMFINKTNIPAISPRITSKIIEKLSFYRGLKVYPYETNKSDGVLIGILTSNKLKSDTYKTDQFFNTEGSDFDEVLGNNITSGNNTKRGNLFIPTALNYEVSVRLILVKRPGANELSLLKSDLGKYVNIHPKIIFNEEIKFSESYALELKADNYLNDGSFIDRGGSTNYTRGQGRRLKSVETLADNIALQFEQEVLDVF